MTTQEAPNESLRQEAERHLRESKESVARTAKVSSDLRWLMGDARGRRLMWHQLHDGGFLREPAKLISDDPYQQVRLLGERRAADQLASILASKVPALFLQMLSENLTDDSYRDPDDDAR